MIDLKEFYSGGYYLVRANDPEWGDEWRMGLLPEKLISLSGCIGRQFEVNWGWIPGDRQAALDFGIPASRLDECLAWCVSEYEANMGLWSMFYSPDAACRFVQRFDIDIENLYLIGIGLLGQADILNYFEQSFSSTKDYGIEKQIAQRLFPEPNGQYLGFEVVSYGGYGRFEHSWLCSGLHQDMLQTFNISPNENGLIGTLDEALTIYQWIKEDDMKGHRAEPEPYSPWLLIRYPFDN